MYTARKDSRLGKSGAGIMYRYKTLKQIGHS
jgi:hypothetical protein